jgi:hypothetical protein
MREISLHLLDLARNGIEAGATALFIAVVEDPAADRLEMVVQDNGRGMNEEMVARAANPFCTTRTTRRVGLGLALMQMTCELCAGTFSLRSEPGVGTRVSCTLHPGHLDCPPLGDMGAVIQTLACESDRVALKYRHVIGDQTFEVDTETLQRELGLARVSDPPVLCWLKGHVNRKLREMRGKAVGGSPSP